MNIDPRFGNTSHEVFPVFISIRKKTFVLIITYLAAAVIALCAYTAVHYDMERRYRRTAEYGYSQAFEELVYAASGLSGSLHRAVYATGPELSSQLCADIYGSCLAAGMSMAALPFSTQELEQTAAFIGIAGDYARSRLRASAQSGFDDAARQSFAGLYKTAAELTQQLRELQDSVNDGNVLLDEPENVFAASGGRLGEHMLGIEDGVGATELGSYGGRYAARPSSRSGTPIELDEARAVAAEYFGLDEDKLECEYTAEDGRVCFSFDGGSVCLDADGNVLSLSSGRSVAGDMPSAELERIAREFLAAHGFGELCLSLSERVGSVQMMEFDCVENGVRCMGDSVRISVAGDRGDIYAFDAVGHVKNHGSYHGQEAAVSESAARAALPDTLSVTGSQLCCAPGDDGSGVLCYGFDCLGSDGEELLVLVNAQTGLQFDILEAD